MDSQRRPPRLPDAVRDQSDPAGERFLSGRDIKEMEVNASGLGLIRELESRRSEGWCYQVSADKVTDEYCGWIADRLTEAGVTVRIGVKPGTRFLSGTVANLSAETLAAVRTHGDRIVEYLVRCRGLRPPQSPQRLPEPGHGVEVIDRDDNYHLIASDDLHKISDWVRWRYRRTKRWFAFTGETWEE
jgi:hypothetical protein